MNASYVERNEAWVQKAREIEQIKQLLTKYAIIEEKLVEELKALSGYEPAKGGGYILSSYIKRGNVDYSQIPELKYVELEDYRKPSIIVWRLDKERELNASNVSYRI